jgi:hypothetical protein
VSSSSSSSSSVAPSSSSETPFDSSCPNVCDDDSTARLSLPCSRITYLNKTQVMMVNLIIQFHCSQGLQIVAVSLLEEGGSPVEE